MKTNLTIFTLLAILVLSSCESSVSTKETYQLKIFSLDSTIQNDLLDNYLKNAYLPALHKAGIEKVGVFKTIEGLNNGLQRVVVFIPFNSLAEYGELATHLDQDIEYQTAAKDYTEATFDNPPFNRIESVLLTAFSGYPHFLTPEFDTEKSDRIYELRNYQSATEGLHKRKVEMFNSGELEIFVELGFQPMFFAEVISGADMPNLMYMTCHADSVAQPENWAAFGQHPTWKEMKAMEKYKNTVSHIDKWMLYPAEYSDL